MKDQVRNQVVAMLYFVVCIAYAMCQYTVVISSFREVVDATDLESLKCVNLLVL